jgi:hypothetical protein
MIEVENTVKVYEIDGQEYKFTVGADKKVVTVHSLTWGLLVIP